MNDEDEEDDDYNTTERCRYAQKTTTANREEQANKYEIKSTNIRNNTEDTIR